MNIPLEVLARDTWTATSALRGRVHLHNIGWAVLHLRGRILMQEHPAITKRAQECMKEFGLTGVESIHDFTGGAA